ncbi:putative U3 small nucleolar RNA-associated protein 11 [Saccoglossus kowalevskii]
MQAQDIKYVNYKRMVEAKKIEKLKSNLHMLDDSTEKPKNKHLFFVDSEKEVKEFDAAKRLDTLPELLPRTYNRPTKKTLQTARLLGQTDADSIRYLANERRRQYKELTSRIEREKELHIVSQKMEVLKNLMDKTQKIKKKEETKTTPAVYKWVAQRKR